MITANAFYEIPENDRFGRLWDIIKDYKSTDTYMRAMLAEAYFRGSNPDILSYRKKVMSGKTGRSLVPEEAPVMNRIFYRLIMQKSQHSLSNGVTINKGNDDGIKERLGVGFDTKMLRMGEIALKQGACFALWNNGETVFFTPLEFIPLYDEWTGELTAGIRFWQVAEDKPMYVQIFEGSGITNVKLSETGVFVSSDTEKYVNVNQEQLNRGMKMPEWVKRLFSGERKKVPIEALFANPERESNFTDDIRANIFRYDRVFTDFGNNLDMTNDIYWVISNFGGTVDEIKEMLAEINELKATYALSDGITGSAGAEPHTVEVPHDARITFLEALNSLIIANFCGIDILKVSGGARTATEIKLSTEDLNNSATRFESEVHDFIQRFVKLATGIEVEDISFKRSLKVNEEITADMLIALASIDALDKQTLLEKHPAIDVDSVETILERLDMELFGGDDGEPDDGETNSED